MAKDWKQELEVLKEKFARLKEQGDRKEYDWTYILPFYIDNHKNRWAIVMAYMDYDIDDLRIYGKVAYQPVNSLMQEYDIDWTMPYNEETGEVDDMEVSIDDELDLKWLIEQAERQYIELKTKEEMEDAE